MRLTFILVFCVAMSVSARTYSQNKRVTLDVKDASASQLFDEIKRQCDYSFFFNEDNLSELSEITLSKSDVTVKEVLDEVFSGTNITYTLVDDVIVIKTKSDSNQESQQDTRVTISGKVSDAETGEPLPGVHIVIKNSILGGATNQDGEFRLILPERKEAVIFSFIGYVTQEVPIGEGKVVEFDIKMQQDIREVGEVVATGYQVIDKRELTSSISTIKAEDMELIGALNVDQMLEGKATGLMISNISATPGAATKVRVRGGSTFTGNQSPLWVIDGVIYEDPVTLTADEINSFDNINLIGNALTGINPSDIEQIDVLKDASATAIYGTRAANGVIVVTTKRGHEGSASISYSGGLSVVQAPQYSDFKLMNSKDRIAVSREMYERNLGFGSNYENIDRLGYEGALMNYWDGTYDFQAFQDQVSYLETLNTDWFGELYRPSISQQHAVSASGGSKTARYYFSMGYDDQQGTEKGVDLNRITARSNLDLDLRKNILLQFKVSGSVQKATYNHTSINVFDEAYYTARTVPIYDQDGEYFYQQKAIYGNDVYGRYNILRELDNSERNITNKDFAVSAQIRWDFLKNFRLTSLASYRNTTNLTEQWITEDTYYIAQLRTYDEFEDMIAENTDDAGYVPFGGIYSGGMVSQDTYGITNQLNYNRVFGEKHVLNVNLGQEARSVNYWGATGFTVPGYNHYQGRGFITLDQPSSSTSVGGLDFANYDYDAAFAWLTNSGGVSIYPTITDKTKNSLSFFGIANYVYDNRYVFNFNMRSDGSNTFGQYERYKFKPAWSASTRWNIHNESFMNDMQLFSELALRASYGVRGTMPSASPYLLISDYGRFNSVYYPENVASLSEFPNANLRWEKTETLNLGLNFSVLDNRVSGAFDYAYSKSTDLIQSRPVSLVNGSSVQYYNSGSKDVSSYEFSIRTVNIKHNKFSWSTNANFSYDHDRVLEGFEDGAEKSLTATDYLAGSIYRKGFPTNGFFSYQFDGLSSEGLPTFKHLVEENMTREEQLEAMLVYEGSRVPLYYGGFGTQVRYGNLSLTANFTYKLGYKTRLLKLYNGNQSLPLPYQNMNSEFNNRWQQPGDENFTDIPALTDNNMTFTGSNTAAADGYDKVYVTNYGYAVPEGKNAWWMYDYSDVRTVSADHIRLKSISVNYNVPTKLLNGTGIKNLNLGVQGSNLAVWAFDKKLKGQDPDQVSGIGMPNLPTYSFSLNMTF
ncbi:SusC/RagA family TonB-linked outer membrane protein [Mangrovibacterium diazotrophicum]|nr:SusC/RagA family TonB-linked outer membrane protein [Mangrovibacterium diazotrophicum]